MTNEETAERKYVSDFFKAAERRAKQDRCVLCGKLCSSFANSHSIPRFVIKRIAVEGKLKTFNDIIGLRSRRNSVNNSWTFHIICSECENRNFSTYEDEDALLQVPTNKILAEIALKNSLLMLHKYRVDCESEKESIRIGAFVGETDVLPIMNALNISDVSFEIRRSKKIIDKELKSGYKLLFYKVLDWVSPLAFQSSMCVYKNLDGSVLNQIYNESKNIRMQQLHVCVFPLSNKTAIMVFVHKDDRNYVAFEKRFNRLSDDDKVEYINYLIFKYTEHALISPAADIRLLQDEKLIDLCEEFAENAFGYGQVVLPGEIPNFLSSEFAIS